MRTIYSVLCTSCRVFTTEKYLISNPRCTPYCQNTYKVQHTHAWNTRGPPHVLEAKTPRIKCIARHLCLTLWTEYGVRSTLYILLSFWMNIHWLNILLSWRLNQIKTLRPTSGDCVKKGAAKIDQNWRYQNYMYGVYCQWILVVCIQHSITIRVTP